MRLLRSLLLLTSLALAACGPRGPAAIELGQESCGYCRMVVDDARFAAQLISARGKTHVFDSIECMASYDVANEKSGNAPRGRWVSDFRAPGSWLRAEDALYMQGIRSRSPMGYSLAAFAPASDTAALARELGGRVMRWNEVRALVARGEIGEGAEGHGAH